VGPLALRAWLAAGLLAVLALPAWGADEPWGYQIAHELMSPFCPGRTLAACPSEKANELRTWILLQEAAGASREEVERELVDRFGEGVLPAPPAKDATAILGYAVPILGIVAGPPLVFWLLRRLTRRQEREPAQAPAPIDDDLAAEVDRELRELDA